jgi:hypothetical protein
MDRRHPAVLTAVGLHLPCLAELSGVQDDSERFLAKLGSLARLALSAAVQKRAFLRGQEDARALLSGGFFLDRAVLMAVPVGLDQVVHHYTGRGLCAGGEAVKLGRRILLRLRDVLRQDGGRAFLETCLDGPCSFRFSSLADIAGLTPWGQDAPVPKQIRAASLLHTAANRGTLALFLPPAVGSDPSQVAQLLWKLWRRTEVVRMRLFPG